MFDPIIWIVHLPERIKTGLTAESDQTVRAEHNCNAWSTDY